MKFGSPRKQQKLGEAGGATKVQQSVNGWFSEVLEKEKEHHTSGAAKVW